MPLMALFDSALSVVQVNGSKEFGVSVHAADV
jgi:hypothetical protein